MGISNKTNWLIVKAVNRQRSAFRWPLPQQRMWLTIEQHAPASVIRKTFKALNQPPKNFVKRPANWSTVWTNSTRLVVMRYLLQPAIPQPTKTVTVNVTNEKLSPLFHQQTVTHPTTTTTGHLCWSVWPNFIRQLHSFAWIHSMPSPRYR